MQTLEIYPNTALDPRLSVVALESSYTFASEPEILFQSVPSRFERRLAAWRTIQTEEESRRVQGKHLGLGS
jgi:hypothetical protein